MAKQVAGSKVLLLGSGFGMPWLFPKFPAFRPRIDYDHDHDYDYD